MKYLNNNSYSSRGYKLNFLTFLIVGLVGVGIYFILSPLTPVLSDQVSDIDILPANLPPENHIVSDLHLPSNDIVERTEPTPDEKPADSKPTAEPTTNAQPTKVLGVEYNQQAQQDLQPVKQVNRIVIPKMGVDNVILEGATADTLWQGIWRMPVGSTPDKGGNTIITAHRYLYRPPNTKTFYLIDKLEAGDKVTVYWEGERYDYEVTGSKIVEPSETSILHNTPNSQLTLFSCTPLFTSKQRLVVTAKLL